MEVLNNRGSIKARMASMTTKHEQYEQRKAELTSRLVRASSDEAEHDRELERLRGVFEKVAGKRQTLAIVRKSWRRRLLPARTS